MPLYVPTGPGKALSIKTHSKHLENSVRKPFGPRGLPVSLLEHWSQCCSSPTPWTRVIPTNTSDLSFEAHPLGVLLGPSVLKCFFSVFPQHLTLSDSLFLTCVPTDDNLPEVSTFGLFPVGSRVSSMRPGRYPRTRNICRMTWEHLTVISFLPWVSLSQGMTQGHMQKDH